MVMTIVILASLLAAFSNALASIFQRQVAGQPNPKKLFRYNFLRELFRHKRWLVGMSLDIAGFLFQALALWRGSLVVVAPVMTMDLIFLMVLLHFKYKVSAGPREWLAVAALAAGISGFLVAADPVSGNMTPAGINWLVAAVTSSVIIIIGVFWVRRLKSSIARATIAGTITGINFAFSAVLTKVAVQQFVQGPLSLATHWQLYALIASLIVSFVNIQSTYGAGSLAVSQPAIEITNPLAGVIFGVVLFGDVIRLSAGIIIAEAISVAVIVVGVIMLSRSEAIFKSKL